MESGVFINYRRDDSGSSGALLYTELVRRFGRDRVFLDCESIPAGADYVEELLEQVRSARVLLAVIGPGWLTVTDPGTGGRRIDKPTDWIRRELAEAFTTGVRVIPVLTEQAEMPAQADLPTDIAALSRRQGLPLRHRSPTADLDRIVTELITLDPGLAEVAHGGDNDRPRVHQQVTAHDHATVYAAVGDIHHYQGLHPRRTPPLDPTVDDGQTAR